MAKSDPRAVLESLSHLLYEQERAAAAAHTPDLADVKSMLGAIPLASSRLPTQALGLGVAGYRAADAMSLEHGFTATPLPADRITTGAILTGFLKGDTKEDAEQRRMAKANQILQGTYAGEVDT